MNNHPFFKIWQSSSALWKKDKYSSFFHKTEEFMAMVCKEFELKLYYNQNIFWKDTQNKSFIDYIEYRV